MKIKIFHVTKMKGISGSENHLFRLLSELDKNRFDVHFCILAEACHVSLLQEYARRLEKAEVTVSILVMHKYVDLSLLRTLRNYIIQEKFHIIHTHLIHADLYGTLAAKLARVSTILCSRHNDDRFRRYRPLIWLNRFLAHWHTKIIVISNWIGTFLQEIEGIPSEKIICIHYGLEPEALVVNVDKHYVREEFQIPEQIPVIGTIGRLTAQKGHSYLLQAVRQVTGQFPNLCVLIIGDGELRSELENQARELGIEANVIFSGYRNDAVRLLSGFDFFVFPSLWEGFGLVLLEAMALRKAVVASEVSAIPESVIQGKTGLLVPPKNAEKLAGAMLTLLNDNVLCNSLGESGYKRLQEDFTVQKMVETTEMLYTNVLSGKSIREEVS